MYKVKVEIHLGKRYIAKKGDAFYYKADKTHYLKELSGDRINMGDFSMSLWQQEC